MLVVKMLMVSLAVLLLSLMVDSLIIPQLTGAGTPGYAEVIDSAEG